MCAGCAFLVLSEHSSDAAMCRTGGQNWQLW